MQSALKPLAGKMITDFPTAPLAPGLTGAGGSTVKKSFYASHTEILTLPISQSWRRNWPRLIPFFDYPPEIRTVIYTTNAIESVNMSLRKLTKNRGSFLSDDALMKLFYLALRNISQKWTMPIRDWKAALNRFTIQFEERIPQL